MSDVAPSPRPAGRPQTDAPSSAAAAPDRSSDRVRDAVVAFLGVMAYGELTSAADLAADAGAAPSMTDRIMVARLAARQMEHFERLVARLDALDADAEDAMRPFIAPMDAYHARTQGATWAERLVKAYVGDGIRTDFYREIGERIDPGAGTLVDEITELDARDDALVAGIRRAIDASPAIEGRLAMWGRRLMGEALSQAQQVAMEDESLAELVVAGADGRGADLAELGRIMTRMADNHSARMGRLGLAS